MQNATAPAAQKRRRPVPFRLVRAGAAALALGLFQPAALHAQLLSTAADRRADYDWSELAVSPVASASSDWSGSFAGDLLRAPARLDMAREAAASWLAAPAAAAVSPQPAADSNPSGVAYAWGYNGQGQLGNNSTNDSSVPVPVSSANGFTNSGVTAISAGDLFSLALQGGAVYAWGFNNNSQLGNNSTTNSSVPVPVSSANGFTNSGVTAIAGGGSHSLALQGGAVYAWGFNAQGQLGNNSMSNSTVPGPVSSANGFTNSGVTAISAGTYHSLAIQGGAVYAWGFNNRNELGNGSTANSPVPVPVSSANGFTNSGVTAIAGGNQHSLALQGGAVYAWGFNNYGQLGNNSTNNGSVPVAVLTLSTGVTSIAAGGYHSLAVQNGNVFAWGYNFYGQLGNNSTTNSKVPVEVSFGGSFLSGIVQVAAGTYSSYALASDGSLYVWGQNSNGQLGDGSTNQQNAPEHLIAPTGQYYELVSSNANGDHALAILGGTAVPEPSTWALLAVGTGALGLALRRCRARLL